MSRPGLLYHHRTRGGGVEGTHISGIAESFERRGWNVVILSPPRIRVGTTGVPESTKPRPGVWTAVSDYSPQLLFEILELSYNLYSLMRIPRALRMSGATLIYERYSLFNWAVTYVARSRGIPIVLEVNDATVIVRSRPLFLKRLAAGIERWIFRNATHLITVSEYFKDAICKRHEVSPERIHVLPNAVDPARFPAGVINSNNATRVSAVLGMVGAFVHWHGMQFLIESIGPFLKATQSKLLLVGDGPERTTIEECIDRLGIRGSVEITGFIPASDVPGFLGRMDICIMANSNQHGSPMKIFEYMAAGKPVLAPAYGPIREIITHQVNGWLFDPLQSASLIEGVQVLTRDPELRRRLGAAARQTVLAKHTWDHRVREVESWIMPSNRSAGAIA